MADTDYTPTQGGIATEPLPPSSPDTENIPPERAALVKKFMEKIKAAEKRYEKKFKQMREDMRLTRKGATKDWGDEKYTANLIQRHVKQRVSSLYAKNPTVKAKRRKTMDYQIWDGNIESAKAAITMAGAAMSGMPVLPGFEQQVASAQALLADIAQGREREKLMDGVGETLEICFMYYLNEGQPPFKLRAKQLVRRAVACAVGYVKIGYQRAMGRPPGWNGKMADASERLKHLQMLADEAAEGEKVFDGDAELEELRLMVQQMQAEPEVILREGLIFDFPRSYDVIPIGDCVELKGFVGCEAVAQRMLFQPDKIKEIYDKDIGTGYTAFQRSGVKQKVDGEQDWACVYEYYDKPTGLMYTLCDGYCDFLEEPTPPPATVEQFFPFFVISFNDIEDEEEIFPPSDPELLRSQQMEYNRAREALRQHRIANQPNYAAPVGAFPDWSDEVKIMSAIPHEILKLNALAPGQKVSDVIQPIQKVPITPELYDTEFVFQDILRTVGSQSADLGPTSGSTATESSIAENSRQTAQSSEIDDMDDMLSQLARAGGQILLKELSADTARKIAGPGAKWPSLSATEIAEEMYLDIEAGSSGKPNKAMELANWERLLPTIIQIPGISPNWIAKESIKRMDDRADMAEAVLDGAPSIMAMNAVEKAASSNPQDQGVHGGDNAERAPGAAGGAQPNYGPEGMQPQGAVAQVDPQTGQTMQPQGAPMPQGVMPAHGMPVQQSPILDASGQPMPAAAPQVDAMGQPMPQPMDASGQPLPMQPPVDPTAQLQALVEQVAQGMQQSAQQISDALTQQTQAAMEQAAQAVQQVQGVAAGVQEAGNAAVAAIQQATSAAVTAIQSAAQQAVTQVTTNATAQGMQALIAKMNEPEQPSPLDAMIAERVGRISP